MRQLLIVFAFLLSGSGPQNRDSELFGFRPFKLIADSFVERGIAVLRCDDRGVGASTGAIVESTSEEFADDALAAVRLLRGRAEIDGARIGLLGHSEGAIAAAIAAARSSDVNFIVWMAGSAVPGSEILRMQAASFARAAGAAETAVDEILRHHAAFMTAITDDAPVDTLTELGRTLVAAQLAAAPVPQPAAPGDLAALTERLVNQSLVVMRSRWMRFFIGFDPSMALRRVACPVLGRVRRPRSADPGSGQPHASRNGTESDSPRLPGRESPVHAGSDRPAGRIPHAPESLRRATPG